MARPQAGECASNRDVYSPACDQQGDRRRKKTGEHMEEKKLSGLRVEDIRVSIRNKRSEVVPVAGVSFTIPRGNIVGIVGESGCGKSMTARAVMGLLPIGGAITAGRILLDGEEISAYSSKQMQKINGNRISMIFQEPMSSLNPVVRVGKQIEESLLLHTDLSRAERRKRVIEIMTEVGIPEPEKRYRAYPFELSGGLRQRVMIAMAMICAPELLIADEPTTALDVTIEAQILHLMQQLRDRFHTSILMITHNLGVVAKLCDSVNVMYLGQIVESCNTITLFENPLHPYTLGLIASIPQVEGGRNRLQNIPGMVPTLDNIPQGCRFCTRCPQATERCRTQAPELYDVGAGHRVRCFLCEKGGEAE